MGISSLGQLCPKLTHLTLAHCKLMHVFNPSVGCPGLQCLTLCGSSFMGTHVGVARFLSAQLKSIDVSATGISDYGLRDIVGPSVAAKSWAIACMQ